MADAERIASLESELAATREAAAALVVVTIQSMGATPEQMHRVADEYQAIADGRQRSRITAIIARMVADRLREAGSCTR